MTLDPANAGREQDGRFSPGVAAIRPASPEAPVTALPVEASGYEIARFNALRHGVLSRYTVLPWEDECEYRALLDALVAEHAPQGGFHQRELMFVQRLEDGRRNTGKKGCLIRASGPPHIGESVHEIVGDHRSGHPLSLS